jgi:hypothetical protein
MIAVVCVYNNKKIFEEYLFKSLQMQSVRFELIALDNSTGNFSSAAQALNHGARNMQTDSAYIMFAHQDISFRSTRWLENVESQLNTLPSLGLAGVAGNNEKENRLISNITYGMPPRSDGKRIDAPQSVMTVDECCAIIPRDVFKKRPFDEETCNNWHLYVVEYCLHIKTLGLEAYVLPLDLHHVSTTGSLNSAYFATLQKVLMRYKSAYQKIYTSSGCWDTAAPVMAQRLSYYAKKYFYGFTRWLIAKGFVPAWMQRKKRKRLQPRHKDR